jgi:hypothetical protein
VPFNGRYARSGAPNPSDPNFGSQPGGGVTNGATGATYVPAPVQQGATTSPATGGGNGGGGGGNGGRGGGRGDDGGGRERPERSEADTGGGGGGGGGGTPDEGFDPNSYESPPQPGGAAAPAIP